MSGNEVFMFPDAGTGRPASSIDPNLLLAFQNNGGFGNNNWIWVLFLFMMWGRNGWGNNGVPTEALSNQMNNDTGRQLLLEALNGRSEALGQIANITNSSVEQVKTSICNLQSAIDNVSTKVDMSGPETINAIQHGNDSISRQLCECCCENRLAICQQTNALQSQMAANDANLRLQLAKADGEGKLSLCQQTNQLGSQADRNYNGILTAIQNQNAMLEQRFCEIKERELQSKIDTQSDIITQLRGQLDNDRQTTQLYAAIAPIQAKVNEIYNKQPNTIAVEYPNVIAVNNTPNGYGCNNGYNGCGCNGYNGWYGNGFGNGIIF